MGSCWSDTPPPVPPPDIRVPMLQADEVKTATKRFSNALKIGAGPSAEVFRANWRGREVALKRLTSSTQGEEELLDEVAFLQGLRHNNVVELLGYCSVEGSRALVFEYASLGSLSILLHGRKGESGPSTPLTWAQRLSILQGAAQGLAYLHGYQWQGSQVVHRRVKSSNVLVFPSHVGKISDPMIYNDGRSMLPDLSMVGNFLDQAPENFLGEVSQKSDVYSFGIILLETVSGRRTMVDGTQGRNGLQGIRDWALEHIDQKHHRRIVDPAIDSESLPRAVLQRFCGLMLYCLEQDPNRRPTMAIVLRHLGRLG